MKPKNTSAAITAILDGVETLIASGKAKPSSRASRLADAERDVAAASRAIPRSIARAAKLANAEREIHNQAERARNVRSALEWRNRYDLWRA